MINILYYFYIITQLKLIINLRCSGIYKLTSVAYLP